MSHYPTVSIVTPSLNQGEFIEDTIISVLSQQGDFFIDYIVRDGGSTDNTVDVIKKYDNLVHCGGWSHNCKGIRFRWKSGKDSGQSDALNKGFAQVDGAILGWLNSDDVYYPGALQRVASLDWEKTDFCYGKGMWISRSGKDICLYPTFKPDKYSLFITCTLCQPTVFFTHDVWHELDKFAEEYYCAFDYDYWLRAVMKSKRFRFIPELLAKSRMYPQNKSLSSQTTVSKEIVAIKKSYYNQIYLNPLLLLGYNFFVNRYADKQVGLLLATLGNE
ncbi:MAG: glycosyltransferase [Proteobacteria bacterium]|nr:glycosyltransferase [Pseudomonadota bacterium]